MPAGTVLLIDHDRLPARIRHYLDGERRAEAEPCCVKRRVRDRLARKSGRAGLDMIAFLLWAGWNLKRLEPRCPSSCTRPCNA